MKTARLSRYALIIAAAMAAHAPLAGRAGENLPLVNGGFEEPKIKKGATLPGRQLEGWNVIGEVLMANSQYLPIKGLNPSPKEGRNALQLFHYPNAVIWQSLKETYQADSAYELSLQLANPRNFRFAGITYGFSAPGARARWIESDELSFEIPNPAPEGGWRKVSVALDTAKHPELVGRPISVRIEAMYLGPGGSADYIDDVRLEKTK